MKSEFVARRDRALEILTGHGVSRFSAAPPLFRGLWRLGSEIRPPHFRSAAANSWFFGVPFGIAYAAVEYWRHLSDYGSIQWERLVVSCFIATSIFASLLAYHYLRSAQRLELPRFEDISIDRG